MKRLLSVIIIAASGFISLASANKPVQPVTAVPQVDLDRYCGVWYEVARLPNWFERGCDGEITATYTKQSDGIISVVNRCQKSDGSLKEAIGEARLHSATGPNSKLEVRFAPKWLSFLPMVWGTYWILDLPDNYSYSLVGEPSRKYLWILSRTPQLPDSTYNKVLDRAKTMGFAVDKMIKIK